MHASSRNEIWSMGAAEIAQAIRNGSLSSREVVEAHLDRIDAINHKVNAVTIVLREEALKRANEADKRIADGGPTGLLHGVPMTVKENIDLAGSATTFGTVVLKDAFPAMDAPHIAQLKRAGAIPIGRTNLSELGLRPHTDNPLRGATLNPWDSNRTPGGSSGGDAVAVATGMTPLGMGNDYGGSLRAPAQFCGVASIKPSLGRVPDHMSLMPSEPAVSAQLFLSQGPMARHVKDLRLALRAMSGADVRDPRWVPAPLEGPDFPKPMKVAITVDPAGQGVDAGVAEGVRRAAKWLQDSGYGVEEIEPPAIMDGWRIWMELTSAEMRLLTLPHVQSLVSEDALRFLQYWAALLPDGGLFSYMDGLAQRNKIARDWAQFQEKYPLVLGPVITLSAPLAGFDARDADEVRQFILASRLVMMANLLGLPAAVVPVGIRDGLPQAVQIIGPRFREDLCLDAAELIEENAGVLTPIDPIH
jgi:amidase